MVQKMIGYNCYCLSDSKYGRPERSLWVLVYKANTVSIYLDCLHSIFGKSWPEAQNLRYAVSIQVHFESIEARMHIDCSQNCTTSLVDDAMCGRSQLINCCFMGLDTKIL